MNEFIAELGWASIITNVLIFVAVSVVLPWALKYLSIKTDDKTRTYMELAIARAIKAAVMAVTKTRNKSVPQILLAMFNDADLRKEIADIASGYLRGTVPQGLARLSVNDEDQLNDVIIARMPSTAADMSQEYRGVERAFTRS